MRVKVVIIGTGARGQCYARYALDNPSEMEITAIAEPKKHLQELMRTAYQIPEEAIFSSYEELLSKGALGDALFICNQDNEHIEPAILAIEAGYKHIMLEKPIDKDIKKCKQLAEKAKSSGANVQVCHSLRYTKFYRKLKEILTDKIIGEIVHVSHLEAVGHFHYAHSFVRGDWSNSEKSSPIILAKCCHDTDLMLYLVGKNCLKISSFGALSHFKKENAPQGSTMRCIDGCRIKNECPFSAMKYLGKYKNHLFREYAVEKEGYSDTEIALKEGRYGRCVYHCDNNVMDHQVVNMEFEDHVTASITMCAFSDVGRETRIFGTMGEIHVDMGKSRIEIHEFISGNNTVIEVSHENSLHGGADTVLVRDFLSTVVEHKPPASDIGISVQSHEMCSGAEISRIENKIIVIMSDGGNNE